MKILVCVSVVPDTTTKITFTDNNTKLNNAGVQYIINPYDELSLTRALELTEAQGGSVTVIHVGTTENEASIRKALAIGAQEAVRIDAPATDSLQVAEEIANYAKNQGFDLILTGRESIDYNGGLVGGLIAAQLQLPFVNIVTKLDIENNVLKATRDIDGGREHVEITLPAVASAQKELCEPRIPNMRGIMAARTKPLQVLPSSTTEQLAEVKSFDLPPNKGACKMLSPEQAGDLIRLLHEEAKVI